MTYLSIVVPCFNESASVDIFFGEIKKFIKDIDNEIIFVDDGSKDDTLAKIKHLADCNDNVKFISFSRNFGKESAIYAGISKSEGKYVAIMDADLQDPPSLLPEMLDSIENDGVDMVSTRRVSRTGEPVIRSFFARLFYKLINRFSDLNLVDGARDYKVMTRQVADAVLELEEYNRFSKGLFNWIGFETKWIEYENVQRVAGETSWSFRGLFRYSIEGIVSFSTVPLAISTVLGIVFSIMAFVLIVFIVVRNILYSDPVQGWASTVCLILLLGGMELFSIGILGKYLEKMYIETKRRPLFLIKETNIDEDKNVGQ